MSRWSWLVCLLVTGTLLAGSDAYAESQLDKEIKQLEEAEAEAIVHRNLQALERLYAEGFSINAADNRVRTRKELLDAIRAGSMAYSAYTREVEHIGDYGDTVVTMGRETAVLGGDGSGAGKKVSRRYTHVWMKQDGAWKLVARHSNVPS